MSLRSRKMPKWPTIHYRAQTAGLASNSKASPNFASTQLGSKKIHILLLMIIFIYSIFGNKTWVLIFRKIHVTTVWVKLGPKLNHAMCNRQETPTFCLNQTTPNIMKKMNSWFTIVLNFSSLFRTISNRNQNQ